MQQKEKHYAALAPLLSLAGIFAHPIASIIIPLILFFIFYWRRLELAQTIALRTADLAFSVMLFLVVTDLLLLAYVSVYPTTQDQAHTIGKIKTFAILVYMIGYLIAATIQALRGKTIRFYLSLRIAERVFIAVNKNKSSS